MRVLILGGTSEARTLTERLHQLPDVHMISSLAGRTQEPHLPCGQVRIGGFGGATGLADYLTAEQITAVIDATHPYATQITANAHTACTATGLPLLVLRRPDWTALPGDQWHRVASAQQAAAFMHTAPPGTILLAIGRRGLRTFASDTRHHYLVRTIDPPDGPLPPLATLLPGRGPFTVDDELTLFREHAITTVVTKNSGGPMTEAKLTAARTLHLPVVMIDRPALPIGVRHVSTTEEAAHLITSPRTQD